MKMTHKSSLDNLIASATTTRNNVKGVQKETLDLNQLEKNTWCRIEKQSTSKQKDSNSCLMNRVPLKAK